MYSRSQLQLVHPDLHTYDTVSSAPPKRRAGRTKFRETRHPVYRGVRQRGSNGERWVCEVRDPSNKSRIWLGTFPTAEMAARAHDVAAMSLRGRKACLNFADSAWRLVVPDSASHKDIQQAAAAAAEMFRPAATAAPVTVSSTSDTVDAEMYATPSSETEVTADEEQSSSSEFDREKVLPVTAPLPPSAVELCSLLDSTEFWGDHYWDTVLTEPLAPSAGYCWDDDTSDCVADISLWSFST